MIVTTNHVKPLNAETYLELSQTYNRAFAKIVNGYTLHLMYAAVLNTRLNKRMLWELVELFQLSRSLLNVQSWS